MSAERELLVSEMRRLEDRAVAAERNLAHATGAVLDARHDLEVAIQREEIARAFATAAANAADRAHAAMLAVPPAEQERAP